MKAQMRETIPPVNEVWLDGLVWPIDGTMSGLWAACRRLRETVERHPATPLQHIRAALDVIDMAGHAAGMSLQGRGYVLRVTQRALQIPDSVRESCVAWDDNSELYLSGQKVDA